MKSPYEPLNWLVAGEAGYGITTMGDMFARACSRAGLHVYGYVEYPSLIRGGHNLAMVRVGQEKVHGHSPQVDVLLALNLHTIEVHLHQMAEGGVIIYDHESVNWDPAPALARGVQIAAVPLARLTKELGAEKIMRNTLALGASLAICHLDFSLIESVLQSTFARKGQDIVDFNVKMARAGYDYAKENFKGHLNKELTVPQAPKKHIVLSGNDAIATAAIKAGLKFMAAYPMTPVTSIMQTVAKWGSKYNIVMKHAEDEIAAMNMAIGASHMGARSMTASSGGGFSLMVEALGMAAITETPLVLVLGTRPGPSTGLPTWTDQSDLRFAMHASQGEFPRVLFLPGDAEECFEVTLKAFNYADKYQMICMILTDKYVGESVVSVEPFEHKSFKVDRGPRLTMEEAMALPVNSYKRFAFTETGVSPRAVPGMPNTIYAVSTDEHKEDGDLDESAANRIKMMDKRAQKLITLGKESLPEQDRYTLHGPANAELTLVGWGSTKGPLLEAMEVANANGKSVNFLQIRCALPFPTESIARILSTAKRCLLVENNSEGQMGGVIREQTGILLDRKLLRYDGRPLSAPDILDAIETHYE